MVMGRLLLIETGTRKARAWAEFMDCQHTLILLPKTGEHPVRPVVMQ